MVMRCAVLSLLAGAVTADAMPVAGAAASAAPELILVSGGCGPDFHRTPFGACRPNGFFHPGFERRCFIRPTPYGPRRFCR